MLTGRFYLLAGVAGMLAVTATAHAGSQVLGDSGWTAHWSDAPGNVVSISSPDAVTSVAVFVEKFINYTSNEPVTVWFQQTRADAVPYVVINDEQVVNHTGSTWSGFTMQVSGPAAFDPDKSNVGQSDGFQLTPFTTGAFNDDNTLLSIAGGTLASTAPDNVWFPGAGPGELWAISAVGDEEDLACFSLIETPIPSTLIPLPAAIWSGLGGLLGLGAIGLGQRLRRR
jgi:hypothetical protein